MFFSAIATSSAVVVANPSSDEVVVITGTRTERSLLDVPVRTEVVTQEQIANMHARDLEEALKNVPGLNLVPIHGKSGSEIHIQGIDGNRVLVLVDGMPVSASTGSKVDVTQIGVSNIKQIEIVKGAVSALYGSEAMGGVVNVITKPPKQERDLRLTIDGGTYGDHDVSDALVNDSSYNVFAHQKVGQGYFQFSADHRVKGGSDLDPSTYVFECDEGTKTNLSLVAGYEFDNGGRIKLIPSWYREDISKDYEEFSPGVGHLYRVKEEVATRANVSLHYTGPVAEWGYFTGYYIHESFEDDTNKDIKSTAEIEDPRSAKIQSNKADAQLDIDVLDNHLLTIGTVAYEASLQQRINGKSELDKEKVERDNIEFYLQDAILLTDELEILPGFRYQRDSDFGSHFTPKFNLMYQPEVLAGYDFKVRAGVGKGYKVPTLKERYFVFDHSAIGYMILGRPDLQPESSTSYQLGFDMSLSEKVRIDVNFFQNRLENLITTDRDALLSERLALDVFRYTNKAKARTQGFDSSLALNVSDNFTSNISYGYLEAVDRSTGKTLSRRPEHQVKLKLNYTLPDWRTTFTLFGRYESESYADGDNKIKSEAFTLFDFKVNTWVTDNIKLFGGVDNLTHVVRDTPATGSDFRPAKGRFIYAGFTYQY
ncbi:TonB-dependent receptor plug domain-containing protein [Thaumasiovibrio subtropicus]|uniref:TonB-dependent receptor plug domain-containing protein n=1 Tax=Thaumasiovibrio subtropicus TaxID=1891207 RepID=UPI00131AF076|nr:TonB-dependent receptor [Thaumasiovibrio subtropicus]